MVTTIQLNENTRERLRKRIKIKGETYDTIINRLLDSVKEEKG
jgi:hypothetical protein